MKIALLLACVPTLFAGSFFVDIRNGAGVDAPAAKDAFLTVRVGGVLCPDPGKATVTAVAEGVVSGQRQSVPLVLTAPDQSGLYSLTKQWPDEGAWLIHLTGTSEGLTTVTLVRVGTGGAIKDSLFFWPGLPAAEVPGMQADVVAWVDAMLIHPGLDARGIAHTLRSQASGER